MKTFVEHLSTYAEYHRDSRNITTHLVGVPMIVFSVIWLLSRPSFELLHIALTPAIVVCLLATAFYLRLNLLFGLLLGLLMGAGIYVANQFATLSLAAFLATGIGLFVVGWIIQFIGHYYEGKKPAFVDDLVGLLIGPLFVTAEILFALGLYQDLKAEIEKRAGKVRQANQSLTSS